MRSQSTYLNDGRTEGRTDGRTWATLNALPRSTNSGGIKIREHQAIYMLTFNVTEKILSCVIAITFVVKVALSARVDAGQKERFSLEKSQTRLDWLQSLKQFFINVSYHILSLKQFFINVSYHILVASLTLMALLKQSHQS